MWIAKVKIDGKSGSIGSRTKKYNVSISGYPISFHIKKNKIFIHLVGFIFGDKINKKRFLNDWKKDKKVLHLETTDNFVIAKIVEPLDLLPMYSHKLIILKPILIDEQGFNLWCIGSWNKKHLIDFIKLVKIKFNGKLLSIKKEKIKDFSVLSLQPHLTKKQKQAIELATKNGYYNSPRKISVKKLAKIAKLSYSTFQVHLRKAEKKLLPFLFKKIY